MEEQKRKQGPTLNLGRIWQSLVKYRKLYFMAIPSTIIVVWLLTLCYPDYYKCKVTLVPESSSSGSSFGALASLASSFGMNIGGANSKDADAITPTLYPDLMKSLDFTTSLFDVRITTEEDSLQMSYYELSLIHI